MKPFNLEEAKAGKPVCTRDGRPVRILCFDRQTTDDESIIALLKPTDKNFEVVVQYYSTGRFILDQESNTDLMMVNDDKPKESKEIIKYCAIFKKDDGTKQYGSIQDTPEKCTYHDKQFAGICEVRIKPIKQKQRHKGYLGLLLRPSHNPDISKLCTNIYKSKDKIPTEVKEAATIIKIEWEE